MTTSSADAECFIWLDLEMTGLEVTRHVIVEIAVLATDAALEPLDDGIDVVIHQPPEALAEMDAYVRTMHTTSGLLPAIETSTVTLEDAGGRALDYVRSHVPGPRTAPLCGNSIGVDRRFLDRHLPELDAYLHYRNVDVSSVKELCRRWYPEAYKQRPGKSETHRALDDVHESIAELRYYRDTIFLPPETSTDAPDASG
jgi:oligoribonuclease